MPPSTPSTTASATEIRSPASPQASPVDADALTCSLCGHQSRVLASRRAADRRPLRRRRECTNCRHRWTTYEVREAAYDRAQAIEQNARALTELLQG
jgi:DNA-directed RNA polymerase subunit M/transcription elongation factor TFIIS